MNDIRNEIYELIAKILQKKGKTLENFDDKMRLREDLRMDSLDLAELTVRIEDKFGVDIFEDGMVYTVEDIIKKLEGIL